MKHFFDAMKLFAPTLAPLIDAAQKDMAEQEAESERRRAEFEQKREEMRRRSDERIDELLRRP